MRAASIQLLLAHAAYAADIDDEYHHTQLLQAKVKPGKAVIAHTDKVPGLLQTGTNRTNRVRACTIGDESCYLAADNLWEPEDIPGYFDCLTSCCQDYDPDLIFDGITCDDIIAMGFACTDEVPGNHIPEGTTLADVCSHTCDPSCEVEIELPAADVGGGCTVAAGENCYLAADNLWEPEDIPGYFDCLQACCQDFDPDRIFDGTTCDDIITAFGFGCDDEVPDLNHIPAGTTVAAFCPGSCGACGADGVSVERIVPDLDFGDSSLVVPSSATYGRPTYSSWSDWNMSHGGNYSNWSDWNWTYGNWSYGNWSYGNWSYGNWSYGNWSYWNWTSGNWSDWNWSSGNSSNGSRGADGSSWGAAGSSWGADAAGAGGSSWGAAGSSWGADGSSWDAAGGSSWGAAGGWHR